jgi:diguanylate cyclase (GGDEF)-like protein
MQSLIDAMKAEEQRLLRLRNGREEVSRRRALTIVVAGDLVAFTLMAAAFVVSAGQSRHRRDAEQQLAHANSQLIERVAELQQRSSELALLSKLGQLLQSCETLEEAGAVVRSIFPKLLPGTRGVVYTIAASRNLVSPITMWDSGESQVTAFAPSDCWALRGGVLHVTSSASAEVVCKHVAPEPDTTFLCIPLVAYGETLGLLHVRFAGVHEESFHVASAAAEQLSLATANLSMQETLRGQAMRDPLTGIFNRRYMEETLERETHRAVRQKTEIGVLLIDLDKFKQYNDTLGHAAGDELLRSAAAIMLRAVRAEDVVCRYGGDEFVIILPDASTTVVEQRARELADSLANLSRPDSTGARVTASIGAALYPRDGTSGKDLLATADRALYQVKRAGRARIGWVSGAA